MDSHTVENTRGVPADGPERTNARVLVSVGCVLDSLEAHGVDDRTTAEIREDLIGETREG